MNVRHRGAHAIADTAYALQKHTGYRAYTGYAWLLCVYLWRRLWRKPAAGSVNVMGQIIHYDDFPTLLFLFREVFIKQEYHTTVARNRPVILDIGANIGLATIYFKQQYPRSVIHCFEPLPANLTLLRKNIIANKYQDISIHDVAISNKDGTSTFYYNHDLPSALTSSFSTTHSGQQHITVKTTRLSPIVKKLRPNIIKMDIEGAETIVLQELAANNALQYVDCFMIEYHHHVDKKHSLAAFLKILEQAGFTYYLDAALSPRADTQDIMVYAVRRKKKMII